MSYDGSFMTREGYEEMKREYEHLKSGRRREISAAIERARAMGDLRENAEYTAAKEAAALNEKRIAEIEHTLSRAQIMDSSRMEQDKALLGARVKLRCLDDNEEEEYMLVAEVEANFSKQKLSVTSPIGKALLGHKQGDVLSIQVPSGMLRYEILSISR